MIDAQFQPREGHLIPTDIYRAEDDDQQPHPEIDLFVFNVKQLAILGITWKLYQQPKGPIVTVTEPTIWPDETLDFAHRKPCSALNLVNIPGEFLFFHQDKEREILIQQP